MIRTLINTNNKHLEKEQNVITQEDNFVYVDKNKIMPEYIELIAKINKKNNNIYWWTSSIASKNQSITTLYRNLCFYMEIIQRMKNSNKETLIISIDDMGLIRQIKHYCKKNEIKFINQKKTCKNNLRLFIRFLSLKIFTDAKPFHSLKDKIITQKKLKKQIKNYLKNNEKTYIIRSWIDDRSFDERCKYSDVFFGDLVDYLKKERKVIILGAFLNSFERNILRVKKNNEDYTSFIIPTPYFIKYNDMIKGFLFHIKALIKNKDSIYNLKDLKFEKHDIYYLLKNEVINDFLLDENYKNMMSYYIVKNVSKTINSEFFAYTFENHSWEKLINISFKKYSPETYVIGYLHSSVSKLLLNEFLAENENKITPLPDKIITTGDKSKIIMEKYCNFSPNILEGGCAFRYNYLYNLKLKNTKIGDNILIACPCDCLDSINLLKFVKNVFGDANKYNISIKCHPTRPIEDIIKEGNLKLPDNYNVAEGKKLDELLKETDVFIYSETTACLEALMLGIPTIRVNSNKYYDADRFFEFDVKLHWVVKTEEDFKKVMEYIYKMKENEFKLRQKTTRKFVENYFNRINEKNLKKFLIKG